MKMIKHIYSAFAIILFALLFISSAVENEFFQVYKTTPENGKLNDNDITFEDDNCKVIYNLWQDGGDIGFTIYNNSDNDLVLNMDKSFFILNGIAYDYYQNRVFTKTTNVGATLTYNSYPYWYYNTTKVTGTTSTAFGTSYTENTSLTIPTKTSKSINEYHIVRNFYSSCDLYKYPSKNNIKSLTFNEGHSPFVFYNIISYTINGTTKRMENKFYVSEITNIPEGEMYKSVHKTNCGEKSANTVRVFKNKSPNKFYFKYVKGKDSEVH